MKVKIELIVELDTPLDDEQVDLAAVGDRVASYLSGTPLYPLMSTDKVTCTRVEAHN